MKILILGWSITRIMNKVIIAGSRSINDYSLVLEIIKESNFKIDEIVCGMAKGVDLLGKQYGIENNISIKEFPAKWDDLNVLPCTIKVNNYGKRYNVLAGHNRNRKMSEYASHLILIWDGKSSGSRNMLKLAKEHGLIIYEKIIND